MFTKLERLEFSSHKVLCLSVSSKGGENHTSPTSSSMHRTCRLCEVTELGGGVSSKGTSVFSFYSFLDLSSSVSLLSLFNLDSGL